MRKVFLGLFCLSFVSSMAWGNPPHPLFKHKLRSKSKIEELGLSFQTIKAGSFMMGSPKNERGRGRDEDQVKVTISKDFEMQTTEVTQKQYFLVTRKRPSLFKRRGDCRWDEKRRICPNHPVERVSWYEAKEFISLLNAFAGVDCDNKTPKPKTPKPRGCYRLPTEAEYEWAVRAGTKTAYFFGNSSASLSVHAIYGYNSKRRTYDVKETGRNPNNLYGMIGNVSEWTEDIYKVKLEGGKDPLNLKKDPLNMKTKYKKGCCRVIRGGGFNGFALELRSASRQLRDPNTKDKALGFRLVRTL